MTQIHQGGASALPNIAIRASDYETLRGLSERAAPQVAHYLERELDRADIVPDDQWDAATVRIGSHVVYREDQTGRERRVTLVWPREADVEHHRISVLTSIGAALLGMQAGRSIDWPAPLGAPRMLTVLSVENR